MTEAWPRAGRGNHHLLPRTISRRLFRHSGDDIDGQRESIRGLVTSHFTQYHYLYGSYGTYTTPPSNPRTSSEPAGMAPAPQHEAHSPGPSRVALPQVSQLEAVRRLFGSIHDRQSCAWCIPGGAH